MGLLMLTGSASKSLPS